MSASAEPPWAGFPHRGNGVGDTGAAALVALKGSPHLQSLNLDLSGKQIHSTGARALAALRSARNLRSLTLVLYEEPFPCGPSRYPLFVL